MNLEGIVGHRTPIRSSQPGLAVARLRVPGIGRRVGFVITAGRTSLAPSPAVLLDRWGHAAVGFETVSWHAFCESAPEFAATVRRRLEAGPYALLGSIRADGHPRISGVIVTFSDAELWLGMPADALKIADLRREPKMSLHSSVSASATAEGDVKLTGRAVRVDEGDGAFDDFSRAWPHDIRSGTLAVFRIDVVDASQVRLAESRDHHVIEAWRAGEQGTRTVRSFP